MLHVYLKYHSNRKRRCSVSFLNSGLCYVLNRTTSLCMRPREKFWSKTAKNGDIPSLLNLAQSKTRDVMVCPSQRSRNGFRFLRFLALLALTRSRDVAVA